MIAGIWADSQLPHHDNERSFAALYQTVLSVIAVSLLGRTETLLP